MNKQSREEKERLKKMNGTFLYNVGYEHINNICDETDKLLEEYKDIEVPDSLNKWFIDYNKGLERKAKYRKIQCAVLKCSKRIAAVVIITSMLCSIVTISVEAFRIRFLNMVIETSQKYSLVSQKEKSGNELTDELPSDWSYYYYPTYLPEGYSLSNVKELNDTKYIVFSDLKGGEINFIQGGINSQSQIDTENSKMIDVDIQGNKGILVIKEEIIILNWSNNEMSFRVQGDVEKSVLLAIAESVEKNK